MMSFGPKDLQSKFNHVKFALVTVQANQSSQNEKAIFLVSAHFFPPINPSSPKSMMNLLFLIEQQFPWLWSVSAFYSESIIENKIKKKEKEVQNWSDTNQEENDQLGWQVTTHLD